MILKIDRIVRDYRVNKLPLSVLAKKYNTTFDLGKCPYTPDFYLPTLNKYIEIKGWWRGRSKAKVALFRQTYPSLLLEVLEKAELLKEGVKV